MLFFEAVHRIDWGGEEPEIKSSTIGYLHMRRHKWLRWFASPCGAKTIRCHGVVRGGELSVGPRHFSVRAYHGPFCWIKIMLYCFFSSASVFVQTCTGSSIESSMNDASEGLTAKTMSPSASTLHLCFTNKTVIYVAYRGSGGCLTWRYFSSSLDWRIL